MSAYYLAGNARGETCLPGSGPQRVLYCYASGRKGAWEAICFDLDIAVHSRSFEEVSRLLEKAIGLYLETVNDLPEAERAAFLSRRVPFRTRLSLAIEAFCSTLRARSDGELTHQFTMPLKLAKLV